MSKAFTKERDDEDEGEGVQSAHAAVQGDKNYCTPAGFTRLQAELLRLLDYERPQIVETVHWAAKNGDRSENGDYLYGKKRLREIDRRVRFLSKRLEIAQIIDPSIHHGKTQIFFGARVRYWQEGAADNAAGVERQIEIVGIDEVETERGQVSWISPIARTLLRAQVGDSLSLLTPEGRKEIEILAVEYPRPNK